MPGSAISPQAHASPSFSSLQVRKERGQGEGCRDPRPPLGGEVGNFRKRGSLLICEAETKTVIVLGSGGVNELSVSRPGTAWH